MLSADPPPLLAETAQENETNSFDFGQYIWQRLPATAEENPPENEA